jgi:hypothetical protein
VIVLGTKLRGIAILGGLLALASGIASWMPGRVVMRAAWFSAERYSISVERAGGVVGVVHALVLLALAVRLWRTPSSERAWQYVVVASIAEVIDRAIDFVYWGGHATTLADAGQVHQALDLAQLAIAFVVLPLVVLLARRTEPVPTARVLS